MLKLKDITVTGNIATMLVLINCREDMAYKLTLDIGGEKYYVVETELPDNYMGYAGHVIAKLRKYKSKDIPTELTVAWY